MLKGLGDLDMLAVGGALGHSWGGPGAHWKEVWGVQGRSGGVLDDAWGGGLRVP